VATALILATIGCGAQPSGPATSKTPVAARPPGGGEDAAAAAPPSAARPKAAAATRPSVAEAQAFMDEAEKQLAKLWVARDRAGWVNENFITDDTEALAAAGEQAAAGYVGQAIQHSGRYRAVAGLLPTELARKLYLLSIAQTVPAPARDAEREELAAIEARMTSAYGKGQVCPKPDSPLFKYLTRNAKPTAPDAAGGGCLHLEDLSRVLAKSRNAAELLEAWRSWHALAAPLKSTFVRYVELANAGAREIGFDDVGALWRSGYDMSPQEFETDVDRLWNDVRPLYRDLHCYVRAKLQARYGTSQVPDAAPIPAQLLGNMWAQEWDGIDDLVAPYPHEPSPDVTSALKAKHWDAVHMVRQGERFFTELGFDPLPATFWERSLFTRPRDRDVVCHASAWDVTWSGDLRIKMCIEPTEQDFVTIHHELGHDFYFQRYGKLPLLFQQGANDGFHEAIGDTIALSVTPEYLQSVGLLSATAEPAQDAASGRDRAAERRRMNRQMRMALDKVAFLPFGLMVDRWRWGVFSGKVPPADYNRAWWDLKRELQGVTPPAARDASDFDAGAKFHVLSSTPYVRYFLARIYQFQFHKALCAASGYTGPPDLCSIHGKKEAGAKLMSMLSLGASVPWREAMQAIGAGKNADAGPMLEYFAPLREWLAHENHGRTCGW
jgi:peptidyl-dipeptidase A